MGASLSTAVPRLIHPLARHEHVARHDDLCLLAALRQTTLRQEYVQPCFIAMHSLLAAAATPSASSPQR